MLHGCDNAYKTYNPANDANDAITNTAKVTNFKIVLFFTYTRINTIDEMRKRVRKTIIPIAMFSDKPNDRATPLISVMLSNNNRHIIRKNRPKDPKLT